MFFIHKIQINLQLRRLHSYNSLDCHKFLNLQFLLAVYRTKGSCFSPRAYHGSFRAASMISYHEQGTAKRPWHLQCADRGSVQMTVSTLTNASVVRIEQPFKKKKTPCWGWKRGTLCHLRYGNTAFHDVGFFSFSPTPTPKTDRQDTHKRERSTRKRPNQIAICRRKNRRVASLYTSLNCGGKEIQRGPE